MFGFNKELTLKDLGAQIRHLIKKEAPAIKNWDQNILRLKNFGFGLRIKITLIEEEDPLYYTIDRKPTYRQPKIIAVSNGFTDSDFDFFQKEKIFPPHERNQTEENRLIFEMREMVIEIIDSKVGGYYQLMLKKYGAGSRINLTAVQEDNPQLIIEEKIIKIKPKKPDSGFTTYDFEFLGKNGLIGF